MADPRRSGDRIGVRDLADHVCKDFSDESSGIGGAVRLKAAWQWLMAAVATSYKEQTASLQTALLLENFMFTPPLVPVFEVEAGSPHLLGATIRLEYRIHPKFVYGGS